MKNNLAFLIESNNVNISSMSKDLEVSRGSIYRVMNGGAPSAELMLKICAYFNKDARDIFFIPNVLQIKQKRKGVS